MSLTCAEARRLLDQHVQPGLAPGQNADLGFHLARCTRCQDYRAHSGDTLLANLLIEPLPDAAPSVSPPASPADAAPPVSPPATSDPPRSRRRPWLRYSIVVVLALLAGWFGILAGRMAYAAYTIQRNVAAMRIDPTPALSLPLDTPSLQPTTATPPRPTPTPRRQMVVGGLPRDEALAVVPTETPLPSAVASTTPVPPTATARSSSTPARQSSATPIRLPTLMPTLGIVPPSDDAVTILLLGSDRRPHEGWSTRSDAIVVLWLDPQQQRVAMLSLPRDLIVAIPGYGQARINTTTVYGDLYPELGGGEQLARKTVAQLLNLPIDYVLRADFAAFTKAVDAIGGIDIEVEQALYDSAYPTMNYGYQEVYIPAGLQHMDGDTALIYARIRHSDSAYARNRRQQQVLLAIMQRVRERNVLGQAEMVADLTSALRDDIRTDLSVDEMLGLGLAFRNLSPEKVERYALDETMVSEGGLPGDPYATFALPGTIELLTRKLVYGPDA